MLLLVTCQQSIVASAEQVDDAVATIYAPWLDALEHAPHMRVALHLHGYLLDRLARAHEGFLLRLEKFVRQGQLEIVGGLFYGGPPSLLSESDVRGQIAMLGEFWSSFVASAPRGIYLPDLAWAPELPRLLEDTGIDYAFAGTEQLRPAGFLSRIERGGLPLVTFGLDTALSHSFVPGSEEAFAAAALAAAVPGQPVAVCVAAERFADHGQGVRAGADALFAAVHNGGAETHLPAAFLQAPPALPAATLTRCYAPWRRSSAQATPAVVDWASFPGTFAEANVLYRRMLRASERLGRAIAIMEDEGLDDSWSDALATAQRLIFAAQSSEALGCGEGAGVLDPAVRRAALGRLIDAEHLLDTLIHQGKPFLEVSEGDVMGDMQPDVVLENAKLTAWLQPNRGVAVRSLDHRDWRINVLDAGTRRAFAGADAVADVAVDAKERRGMRCAWFAADASMEACITGQAHDLLGIAAPSGVPNADAGMTWQNEGPVQERGPSPSAQQLPDSFALVSHCSRDFGAYGRWSLEHGITVATHAFGLRFDYRWQRHGKADEAIPTRWALELPMNLGAGALQIYLGGKSLPPGAHPLPNGAELTLRGSVGTLYLRADCKTPADEAPCMLWFAPLTGMLLQAGQAQKAHLGAALWLTRPVGLGVQGSVWLAASPHA